MVGWTDVIIVTLLATGATVLIGVLGYFIDKSDESAERREPAERRELEKR
jgi:hypothetical protein